MNLCELCVGRGKCAQGFSIYSDANPGIVPCPRCSGSGKAEPSCVCCGEPSHDRDPDPWGGRLDGYCEDCALTRCDAYPGECQHHDMEVPDPSSTVALTAAQRKRIGDALQIAASVATALDDPDAAFRWRVDRLAVLGDPKDDAPMTQPGQSA